MKRLVSFCVVITVVGLPGLARAAVPAGRLGVGDSIMLSASDELAAVDIDVNAEVGRQFDAGVAVVKRLVKHDRLPHLVIVHLGTNGPVDPADCSELVRSAPHRRIFLVSVRVPRPWQDPNNEVLNACASAYERVHILRWAMASKDHPEWYADDGYHIIADGQVAYAAFLLDGVRSTLAGLRVG